MANDLGERNTKNWDVLKESCLSKRDEISLREWEQRYETYRAYCNNYLTVLSISAGGYILAVTWALGKDVSLIARLIIFIFLFVLILVLKESHQVAIQPIGRLCLRLETLQKALKMEEYPSADLLKIALPITDRAANAALIFNLIMISYIYCCLLIAIGIFNPSDLLDHRLNISVNIFNLV